MAQQKTNDIIAKLANAMEIRNYENFVIPSCQLKYADSNMIFPVAESPDQSVRIVLVQNPLYSI